MNQDMKSNMFKVRTVSVDDNNLEGIIAPVYTTDSILDYKICVIGANCKEYHFNISEVEFSRAKIKSGEVLDCLSILAHSLKEYHKCRIGLHEKKRGYTEKRLSKATGVLKLSWDKMKSVAIPV